MEREKLYLQLPIFLQNVACSIEGLRIRREHFNSDYESLLAAYKARNTWDQETTFRFRDERLRRFVAHCVANVPYYQRKFEELKIDAQEIRSLEDLRVLPVISKVELQQHMEEFVASNHEKQELTSMMTSGTTGGGLRIVCTKEFIQEQWAVWSNYYLWHGITREMWVAYFGGRTIVPSWQQEPPYWRVNHPGRQILFSGYHMSPVNLRHYVDELNQRRPPRIHGYPSLITLLARHVLETGQRLQYQLDCVSTGAESLLPHQAESIREAFGVEPIQHYGLSEAVANASECKNGRLHIDETFAAVEFVPGPEKDTYILIGTNLSNPAMPLLRYSTGDVVRLAREECRCGLPGRVIDSIDGRREDYVVLKSGARIGRLDHLFKAQVNIREAQIVQQRVGEMQVKVVRGEGYRDSDEYELKEQIRKRLGDQIDFRIEYVHKLPRTSRGKLRLVISEIEGMKIAASSK